MEQYMPYFVVNMTFPNNLLHTKMCDYVCCISSCINYIIKEHRLYSTHTVGEETANTADISLICSELASDWLASNYTYCYTTHTRHVARFTQSTGLLGGIGPSLSRK